MHNIKMDIDGLMSVNASNFHQNVFEYIQTNNINVESLDNILDVYLNMLRDGYCFTLDRELVHAFLMDILYVLNPTNNNMTQVKDYITDAEEEIDNED